MKHVLSIDQGTTGSTCLMVSRDGSVKGRGYREIAQRFPRPGWVDASSFLATRDYTRWTPGTGAAAAREGKKAGDRAVRAALSWPRDSQ